MALRNIFDMAGGWAEIVALSPMLTMFDNSELTIDNDIPTYDGPVAFLGQGLALALVAIGAVKKIFQTNEEAYLRRKRSSNVFGNDPDDPDVYFRAAASLDRYHCVVQFLCHLAFQAQTDNLSLEQETLVKPFMMMKTHQSNPHQIFSQATSIGSKAKTIKSCRKAYPSCPYPMELMNQTLQWIHQLQLVDLKAIIRFLKMLLTRTTTKPTPKSTSFSASTNSISKPTNSNAPSETQ